MAATAVEAWDERWAAPEGRGDWLVPHPAVAGLVPVLKARDAQHVLDLGCGVGRHAMFFAEHGFAVEAIDGAAVGLDFACREAAARGLRLSLRQADADALPFADESFDYSSLSSATASQFSPTAAARSRYSFTVERAIRTLRDTAVSLSPSPSSSRNRIEIIAKRSPPSVKSAGRAPENAKCIARLMTANVFAVQG